MGHSLLRHLDEKTALPIALLIVCLVGFGDALTGAEVAFTLLYLLPIAIATWFRGWRVGLSTSILCVASSGLTDVVVGPRPSSGLVLVWNLSAEALIFLMYADMVARLRRRLDLETQLRMSALEELRHAERLNTIGKLAAGMAHELGTPLNVVAGRAELISTGRLDLDGSRASAIVIVQQTERMATIIRHMLDFGRRGGTKTRREDLRALCDDTAELLRSLAKRSGVEISVSGDAVEAPVNRSEIQQVLSNLISNAVHSMPHGGLLRLSVESVRARLPEPHDRTERDYALVTVSDEGTGISPEILPRIFEPFFTTKPEGEGTGLGLSVAYGIVCDHGGAIRVRSALGKGTSMLVYLTR